MKRCRRCGEDKPRSEFTKGETRCRPCNRERAAEYRARHPEQVRAAQAKYKTLRRKRYLANRRARYEENRERELQRGRAWKRDNPEWQREYDQRNKEAKRERWRRWKYRVRASRGVPYTRDALASRMAYFGHRCWMCGAHGATVDHVKPISVGGADILCNLRPACMRCNCRKGRRWPWDGPVFRKYRLSIVAPDPEGMPPLDALAELFAERAIPEGVQAHEALYLEPPRGGRWLVVRLP